MEEKNIFHFICLRSSKQKITIFKIKHTNNVKINVISPMLIQYF